MVWQQKRRVEEELEKLKEGLKMSLRRRKGGKVELCGKEGPLKRAVRIENFRKKMERTHSPYHISMADDLTLGR